MRVTWILLRLFTYSTIAAITLWACEESPDDDIHGNAGYGDGELDRWPDGGGDAGIRVADSTLSRPDTAIPDATPSDAHPDTEPIGCQEEDDCPGDLQCDVESGICLPIPCEPGECEPGRVCVRGFCVATSPRHIARQCTGCGVSTSGRYTLFGTFGSLSDIRTESDTYRLIVEPTRALSKEARP